MPSVPTATDERLAEGIQELTKTLTDFRVEVTGKLGSFQGSVTSDLRWIKWIGASVLATAIAGSVWVIREITTVKDDVRQHEARLNAIDQKLDILISRTAPKTGG
jgi:hypothetical protein